MVWSFVFVAVLVVRAALAQEPDIVIADFEGSNYGDWKVTGTAFGGGPAQGTLPGQMKVDGFLGHGLVNSFNGGDGSTGTLTSPPFKIERKYLQFLIGGGGWEGKTCMNLLVDGKIVRTATGSVDAVWSSHNLEHLHRHEVPVALAEFRRVLRPGGQMLLTLPDLQRIAELVAADGLEDEAYSSPAGPITALDMIYGHTPSLARGNRHMAHKTGFTARTLTQLLTEAGFTGVALQREGFALWARAYKPAA